ncbi:hypothetical protein [Mesorhizobium sp.]|uniref:hypothetical protein n=1 Tax=Mesorhizobium sp. TaxID=1871066 RepID=UPI000FE45E4C|nr:hypothetical protein [Mesorhizobium sp.]RWB04246.1 MAG: hypothetical protein EOQ33_11790 [Mesorhizobium sp.]RWO12870.1 MAG: hypothetical protein EOS08_30100 [Mesorhizobium sp.]
MVPLALFSFKVGVELGQLMFIAVVLVAIHLVQRVYELPRQAVVASAYVIGTTAAFWSIERLDSMFMERAWGDPKGTMNPSSDPTHTKALTRGECSHRCLSQRGQAEFG